MSTHNICFRREIRKISILFSRKKLVWPELWTQLGNEKWLMIIMVANQYWLLLNYRILP